MYATSTCRFPTYFSFALILLSLFTHPTTTQAQCPLTISTFPYQEDFETDQGGWTAGGTMNDWAWGTPNKPTINTAGSGNNCWVTGGLTGSFYNFNERAYVESPCFDFTTLSHPYIYFQIWWESEQRFDGANLQYSLDNGSSWNNVGATNDPDNCLNENWFNYSPITHLSALANPRDGWSGTIQPTNGSCQGGQGSNGWVTARHCMPYLAKEPLVQFRFTFGAGSTCNDYDGIAFDDIHIENAPPIVADFTATCIGNNSFAFANTSTNCPDTWSWDFDDSASGANNSSTLENPTHTFSGPGIYTVTLQSSSACSPGASISKTITVYGINTNTTAVDCHGNATGSASAQVFPAGGNPTFSWNTTPPQIGPTASGLTAGTYIVLAMENDACPTADTVIISEPEPLQHTVVIEPAYCGNLVGAATITETGGIGPYFYNWSPQGGQSNSATGLPIGNYIVSVTDQNGCLDTLQIAIISSSIQIGLEAVNISCFGADNGSITLSPLTGSAPFTYNWAPSIGDGPAVNGLSAGTYSVTITDANQCTTERTATISEPPELTFQIQADAVSCFGDADGAIQVNQTSGGSPPYQYALGQTNFSSNPAFEGLLAGSYTVQIQDALGCILQETILVTTPVPLLVEAGPDTSIVQGNSILLTGVVSNPESIAQYAWTPALYTVCDNCLSTLATPASTTQFTLIVTDTSECVSTDFLTVEVQPGSIYIPNVFAPASILLNDHFTVYGAANVQQVDLLQIYDRWGSLVFENTNFPASDRLQGWDGRIKGKDAADGVYIYLAKVQFIDGSTELFKGDVLLLR